IGQCFVDEQQHRARLRMGFPTPNYNGVKTAPGLIVVVADFRFIKAFPVLNDGSELDRLYKQNAERILLQSVAASTMSLISRRPPSAMPCGGSPPSARRTSSERSSPSSGCPTSLPSST